MNIPKVSVPKAPPSKAVPVSPKAATPKVPPPKPVEPEAHQGTVVSMRSDGKPGLPVVKEQLEIPPRECATCHIGAECPEYQEGYVCFYDSTFKGWDVRSSDGLLNVWGALIQKNLERLQMAYLSEQVVAGGQIDANVTRLSEVVMGQMQRYVEIKRSFTQVSVAMRGPSVVQKVGGSGILSKIFSAPAQEREADLVLNPDDSNAEEVVVTMTRES